MRRPQKYGRMVVGLTWHSPPYTPQCMELRGLGNKVMKRAGFALVRYPAGDAGRDEHLASLLRRLDINCVIDVGAHFGEFGTQLRSIGYGGEIASFEPVADSFEKLEAAIAGDERWRAHRLALGSEEGELQIKVPPSTNFASFLEPSDLSRGRYSATAVDVEHEETVAVERLDVVLPRATSHVANPRVFVKLDTQGWDLEVMRGASGCLSSILALETELSVKPLYKGATNYLETLGHLGDVGFEPVHFSTESRDDRFRLIELNCLLLRDSEADDSRV